MKKLMSVLSMVAVLCLLSSVSFASKECNPGTWKKEGGKVFTCPAPGKFFPDTVEVRNNPQQWRIIDGEGTYLRRGESIFLDDVAVFITCDNKDDSSAPATSVRYELNPGEWAPGSSRIDGPLLCGNELKRANSLVSISDVDLVGSFANAEGWAVVLIKFDRLTKLEAYWTPEGLLKNFHNGIEVQVMDKRKVVDAKIGYSYLVSVNLNVVREKMGSLEKPFRLVLGTRNPMWGQNLVDVRIAKREDVSNEELKKFPGAAFLGMTLMTTMGGWEPKTKKLDPIK